MIWQVDLASRSVADLFARVNAELWAFKTTALYIFINKAPFGWARPGLAGVMFLNGRLGGCLYT
jgi:hypothetical protein